MPPITLRDASTGSTAKIAPDLGFNCFAFQAVVGSHTVDVIDAAPDFAEGKQKPSHHGIPILFPYPNRIAGGKYTWDGTAYEIPDTAAAYDAAGNAIHGFCLDRPWRVIAHDDRQAIGQFQLSLDAPHRLKLWPSDCFIEVRYTLVHATLRADIRVANPGHVPLPWGLGTHPYFRVPLGAKSTPKNVLVQAPASEEWELVNCLPTGQRKPVPKSKDLREGEYFSKLKLDDVLTGLEAGGGVLECVIMDEKAGLQVAQRSDKIFRELVVYTPANRDAICLEPYTCVTDAINLEAQGIDTGLQVLPPGQEVRTWIEISVEPVVA